MSRRHLAFALLLAALAVPTAPAWGASSAIGAGGIAAGSIEFSPTVTFSHSNFRREGYGNVETSTQLTASPTLGYCVSDHWEVTGGLLMRHHSENGVSDTALGASAGLGYNFSPQGAFIPFANVGFGALFYDGFSMDDTAVLAPTLTGGVRVLVGPTASVNMSLGYQHESNANGEFNASANRVVAGVGVSLFPWHTK